MTMEMGKTLRSAIAEAEKAKLDLRTAPLSRDALSDARVEGAVEEVAERWEGRRDQLSAELEREGVVYVKRGQGTFVAPSMKKNTRERQNLARTVAKHALLEARRSGLDVDEQSLEARRRIQFQGLPAVAGGDHVALGGVRGLPRLRRARVR